MRTITFETKAKLGGSVLLDPRFVRRRRCATRRSKPVSTLAVAKQVQLETNVRDSGLVIHADRERILQVLSNLIGNALKFSPRGGHVTIAAKRHDDEVQFAVLDTGPGISGEHLSHVFERFWKHETPGIKSTGLGLFIAKAIVEAHGGRIWAESELGHGARFYFTILLEVGAGVPVAKAVPQEAKRGA
jgi:signal transduction histidine kinase